LQKKREEWAFTDADVTLNFYVFLGAGVWTHKFCGTPANEAIYKSRGHVVTTFHVLYEWPKSHGFRFSTYTELGANMLAREWCRKSDYFYNHWLDSEVNTCFDDPTELDYVEHEEFLAWVATVDVASHTWVRVSELKHAVPTLK
jgi:hypothetical protein